MNIIDIKHKNSLKTASKVLLNNGILVFPTDTVYGIGCILDEKAILKLYQIKNRPLTQPTAILMNKNDIPTSLQKEYAKYLPGQVTIIADAKKYSINFPDVLIKDNKIGVRIPNDKWLQQLLEISGPIVASSANLAGESTPKKFSDVSSKLLKQVNLAIKSDQISTTSPSTVYDVEENLIIRS